MTACEACTNCIKSYYAATLHMHGLRYHCKFFSLRCFSQKTPPSIDEVLTTSKGKTFYILREPGEHGLLGSPESINSMKTCATFLTDKQGMSPILIDSKTYLTFPL